jgi:hypothetical protein
MSSVDNLYNQLKTYMEHLRITFLDKYLHDPLANPQEYELQIRAYCVLAHAALEEYFENVAVNVLSECINQWKNSGKLQDSLIAISIHYLAQEPKKDLPSIKGAENQVHKFDSLLKGILALAEAWFKDYAFQKNHGAGISYLKRLLQPVGIDISNNIIQLASLDFLVTRRGDVAHTFSKQITTSHTPQAFLNSISDCLDLCDDIRSNANKKII